MGSSYKISRAYGFDERVSAFVAAALLILYAVPDALPFAMMQLIAIFAAGLSALLSVVYLAEYGHGRVWAGSLLPLIAAILAIDKISF